LRERIAPLCALVRASPSHDCTVAQGARCRADRLSPLPALCLSLCRADCVALYEILISVSRDLHDYQAVRSVLATDPDSRSADAIETLVHSVRHLKFFQVQQADIQARLCRVMRYGVAQPEQIICRQGDEGTKFFVILSGSVSIHVADPAAASGSAQAMKEARAAALRLEKERDRQRELLLDQERIEREQKEKDRKSADHALAAAAAVGTTTTTTTTAATTAATGVIPGAVNGKDVKEAEAGKEVAVGGAKPPAAATPVKGAVAGATGTAEAKAPSAAQMMTPGAAVASAVIAAATKEAEEERRKRELERAASEEALKVFRKRLVEAPHTLMSNGLPWSRLSEDEKAAEERKELVRLEKLRMEREREAIFGRKEPTEPLFVGGAAVPHAPGSAEADVEADFGPCVLLCTSGHSFGERALIASAPRAATVIARERTELMVISKEGIYIHHTMHARTHARTHTRVAVLCAVSLTFASRVRCDQITVGFSPFRRTSS
jgi:CRP-like cAMP-binding protein